ncbi:MAG: AAA family ATPase [Chloroflexi bacterium]|nr:AAA family ATPase [Chloroflexota bacterium]
MNEREHLQQTIAAITAQRILLGDSVVETTVAALHEQLEALDRDAKQPLTQRAAQRKQITILFANVTGFTSIAQTMPDTNMLDVMNLLWQQLDKTITVQGGTIDKHIGDAVMGLFGVPIAREDDPERAIRAALAMRATLSDFVNELNARADQPTSPAQSPDNNQTDAALPALQLRVGINTGPVLLGGVGTGDEYTVIGDAVNVASRLERAAPAGGILIAHDTYLLVHGIFDTEPLGPVTIRGKSDPVQVYLALGAKPRRAFLTGRGVEGVETRLVGRDAEMRFLQKGVQTAVSRSVGQVITIAGEAGVGKSRLMQEFNDWVLAQPQNIPVFKGQTDQRMNWQPYSLIRSLIASHFNIQDSDSSLLVEEKLVKGMRRLSATPMKDTPARARTIGQLIGLNLASGAQFPVAPTESPQVRNRAYGYLYDLFAQVAASAPATLIILEDVHWADEASLDLLDHLAAVCRHAPLLICCLTRPSLFETRAFWGKITEDRETAVPQTTLNLRPLTEDESRQLVADILRKLPEIPDDLSNLVVAKAEGNPFYVEEIIKVFIEDGLILAGKEQWQLQSTHLSDVRIPSTLTGVLQARLDRLSELERTTLQRAAVIGRMFWDSAVIHMNELAGEPLHASETIAALQALQKREMIFKRHTAIFSGIQTYYFKHAILREVTYEGVLLRDRPLFHRQAADWLAEQSGERIAEYARLIAEHYELAGKPAQATELYEMAAMRAENMSDPESAIEYYGKALSLLSEQAHDAVWQLRLQQRLGTLLHMQARLVEAAQTYMTMRYTAKIDGDLAAQAHAWNGLARVHQGQANFAAMLESATQSEQVSWLVSADEELTQALLCKSEAHFYLGDTELAAAAANRALTVSDGHHNMADIAQSLNLLCRIYMESGRHSRALLYLEELADQLDLQDLPDEIIALNRAEQGRRYRQLERYDQAAHQLIAALDLYRELDYQSEIGATLNQLGELARLRGNSMAAIPLFREALSITEAIGDEYAALFYRTNLGGALAEMGEIDLAEKELQTVLVLAQDMARVVSWIGLSKTYRFLSRALLARRDLAGALAAAEQAFDRLLPAKKVKATGALWRVLGQIAAQRPSTAPLLMVKGQTYDAPACFTESLRQLREESRGMATQREQALTLRAWAAYAAEHGESERGTAMEAQAQALAAQLGLELDR